MVDRIPVLVHTPAHAGLGPVLSYLSPQPLAPGTLVRVPLGKRETLGLVWQQTLEDGAAAGAVDLPDVRDIPGAAPSTAAAALPTGYVLRPIAGIL